MDPRLVQSIKKNLSGKSSDELRQMLAQHDVDQFSPEAFVAAQEVLDDRASGVSSEPLPPPPPMQWTPEQQAREDDARLRYQVRLIGIIYYLQAIFALISLRSALSMRLPDEFSAILLVYAIIMVLLGWSVRRFYRPARVVGIMISLFNMLAFPIGTLIGIFCFVKLTQAAHLFNDEGPTPPSDQPN